MICVFIKLLWRINYGGRKVEFKRLGFGLGDGSGDREKWIDWGNVLEGILIVFVDGLDMRGEGREKIKDNF